MGMRIEIHLYACRNLLYIIMKHTRTNYRLNVFRYPIFRVRETMKKVGRDKKPYRGTTI